MKRNFKDITRVTETRVTDTRDDSIATNIDEDFLENCETEFNQDPLNIVTRNAVVSMGSFYSTINSTKVNEINHIFLNSVKKRNSKATNQGHSGRCWMFAALNTFRHMLIQALNLENFEFSEVYLFFWDKLERANSYLLWFINHPEYKPGDRAFDWVLSDFRSDGGWWNTFANLVNKYGLVPRDAMKETFQSTDSDDMNSIVKERLDSCVNRIMSFRKRGKTEDDLHLLRKETIQQVYNILVKFLGEPPKSFCWSFVTDDESTGIISNLTPHSFKEMVIPEINLHDFVVLSNIPTKLKFGKNYTVRYTRNVSDGEDLSFLNVSTDDLSRYAITSILAGMAVWFTADVKKHFNPIHSTLDDELDQSELVFGRPYKFQKGEKIILRNIEGNHAMAFTGVNVDSKGKPVNWQVENSWGYWDNEEPGLDGFLNMSNSWFQKYVMEIVVHKRFLSRSLQKLLKQETISLEPWDSMAPALRAGCVDAPRNYLDILGKKRRE